ncbi:nitronate monooxygenase [Phenylobacterium sp.]|uniref:NAD(P)H-dependent flavin oxidoreductase n=1 Tax=Phenylobacterium sp. TaxID=1871053 RepID=UPI00301B6C9B
MAMTQIPQRLPARISERLSAPLIVAPMLRVSGPDLVIATCRAGAIGSFPTKNARSVEELDAWLTRIDEAARAADRPFAPHCPNIIMRSPDVQEHAACVNRHGVELVITSVGSPAPVVQTFHDHGCLVFADVATVHHARRAVEAGADGLVLLTAGAGGQTGWLNPFAYVRAVRAFFDGPIVLGGGMIDGHALWAAQVLGCDLGYMGTKFIATAESMAADAYRDLLVDSSMDDVMLTRNFTGLQTNVLRPSIVAAGIDPAALDEGMTVARSREVYGGDAAGGGPRRWTDIKSAGHTVSGVQGVLPAGEVVEITRREYEVARYGAPVPA